jgi:arylsulfatase A-like enzyme
MQREYPVTRWYDRFFVALAIASAVGVIWSVQEALSIDMSSVGFVRIWSATGIAAGLVTVISTLVGGGIAAILLHQRVGPAILNRLSRERLFQWGLFLLIVSFGTLFTLWLFQTVFASAEVHRLAMALISPVLVLLAAGVAKVSYPVATRFIHGAPLWFKSPRLVGGFTVIVLFAWLACLGVIAPEVVVNLSPRDLLPIAATLVAAWIGALFLRPGRWAYLGAMPCALLLLGLSVHFMVSGYDNETRIAVSRATHGAKLVHWQLTRLRVSDDQIGRRTGSCFNGISRAKAGDVGSIDKNAPDIVLLLVDGLQWNHTSFGGYGRNTTPNLAKLGEKAAVFRAYSPATCTRQSVRSLFSGVFPSQVKAPVGTKWGVTFSKGQETLASLLRAAGYETVAIDMTNGVFRNQYNALHGFDIIDIEPYKYVKKHGYSTPSALARIRAHLSRPRVDNKPRFIWVQLMDTHPPYSGGPESVSYGNTQLDKYDSAIHFVDQELEQTINFITAPTRAAHTFLLLSADHGFTFHKGRRLRTDVYDSGVQVPLMIWGPTVRGKSYRHRLSLLDVYATVFGIAGLDTPRSACGVNLLPDIVQGAEPFPADVYLEQIPDHTRKYFDVAFIRGDLKLILRPNDGTRELYDLRKDPKEQHNLAATAPQKLSEMIAALGQYYRERNFSPKRYGLGK